MCLVSPKEGWLAGDGGLVLTTLRRRAIVGSAPQDPPHSEQFDFRACGGAAVARLDRRHAGLAGYALA